MWSRLRHFIIRLLQYFPLIILLRVVTIGSIAALIAIALMQNSPPHTTNSTPVPAAPAADRVLYTFNVPGTIEETGDIHESKSPYWWLDSGGRILIHDDVGETLQGDIAKTDPWYREYADTNPEDTEDGLHPQNLLRLVSRNLWNNVRVEASFYVVKDNLSASENRNESNGLFLMSRYMDDGQTLYYAGIRVDGTAVIKKKYKGQYYTMAQETVFQGTYDHAKRPSLLPHSQWLRLQSETVTKPNGDVYITLSMQDTSATSTWKKLIEANDRSQHDHTPPITGNHSIGIRTDFMDVRFDDILAERI